MAVGDIISAWDGSEQAVVGVFQRGVQPLYRLSWDDGSETICDADHLWFGWWKPREAYPFPGGQVVHTLYIVDAYGKGTGRFLVPRFGGGTVALERIEPAGEGETACIAVSHRSGLFVIENDIITHNSDLLIGLATTQHQRSIIFRREYPQLKAIEDRTAEIVGGRDGFNAQQHIWNLKDGRRLEFGATQFPGDEQKYQGRPHDFKGFDELTHFTEAQFRFLTGWTRTSDPNQRVRIVGASNPPTDTDGEWVIPFWGPWLDEGYSNPAKPGELRWFIRDNDRDVEVEGPEPVKVGNELITPKSRTFIPARVEDNPYLMASGYKATLQALPEPLRSIMLEGKFGMKRSDDPWQVIPTDWIQAAMDRWTPEGGQDAPMTAMGVDIAQGGGDRTVLSPRHGTWFAPLLTYPGTATPDGPSAAALVVQALRDGAQVHVDLGGGFGGSAHDHLKSLGARVKAMVPQETAYGTTRDGMMGFANARAEWWWRMREALDPAYGDKIALPPSRELRAELAAPRWKPVAKGIQIESKEDIRKRLGRSPDLGDAVVLAYALDPLPVGQFGKPVLVYTSPGGRGPYNPLARYGKRR